MTIKKLRRGTTAEHSSFTGAEGEITIDTDKNTLVIHDGITAGGNPIEGLVLGTSTGTSQSVSFAKNGVHVATCSGSGDITFSFVSPADVAKVDLILEFDNFSGNLNFPAELKMPTLPELEKSLALSIVTTNGGTTYETIALNSTKELLDINLLFSTDLYTGNGSAQTITNGIDLAGEGGLVWIKWRSGGVNPNEENHFLFDSERGTKALKTNSSSNDNNNYLSAPTFNSNGFAIENDIPLNRNGADHVAWTFRQAPKFFDVVTYTGDGSARSLNHNLGITPGLILIKCSSVPSDWVVGHIHDYTKYLRLNSTVGFQSNDVFSGTDNNSFRLNGSISSQYNVNEWGDTYVAYLFAHDPAGNIQCGSYTGSGAGGNVVNLGWQPQWLLVKNTQNTSDWWIVDSARGGFPAANYLEPNTHNAETNSGNALSLTPTGFTLEGGLFDVNQSGANYIYVAIRAEGS